MLKSRTVPSLAGATAWLNATPLDLPALRGRVVVVNFWTYTCINWLRTVPSLRAWARAYADDGLTVVGVHTPEFSFEHALARVRRSVELRGLFYPVALDSDYEVWRSFGNQYWPALYLLDRDGTVRDKHFGETGYDRFERRLQHALGVSRETLSPEVAGEGVERSAAWRELRTPETYLGVARRDGMAFQLSEDSASDGVGPPLDVGRWALLGPWASQLEYVSLGESSGRIRFEFHARDAHLVAQPLEPHVPFRVLLDGASPGPDRGADIDVHGNGVMREARLYQLVRQGRPIRSRTLEVIFPRGGVRAYAFTFG